MNRLTAWLRLKLLFAEMTNPSSLESVILRRTHAAVAMANPFTAQFVQFMN